MRIEVFNSLQQCAIAIADLHIAYLETWYHIAAMLSCRYSGPGSRHYARRLASAQRILGILQSEGVDGLPPLPLVPYAMSMSTTMIYRAFRDGQRDINATHHDLRSCCEALDTLSLRWTTAKGIAKLAKRLLKMLHSSTSVQRPSSRPSVDPHLPQNSGNVTTGLAADDGLIPAGGGVQNAGTSMHANEQTLQHMDSSYTHMDRAFAELFDYSMPNVFRGPANLDYFMPNDEEGSTGSDFHFPAYLSPDVDFGYPVVPGFGDETGDAT